MSYPAFHDTEVIVQHLHDGDARTFKSILTQFYPALCFFANRLTNDPAVAENIAAETMDALWHARKQFTNLDTIKFFLYDHATKASLEFVKSWQKGIKDDEVWLQIWKETETYIQHEIIRAELLRYLYQHKKNIQANCSDSNHPEHGSNSC
jgi:RNA polymerase sigma-70 factor (ECF subfamily)